MGDWIDINLPFWSFYTKGLSKPGVLIETEHNEVCLIGHMNIYSGVCDDCVAFSEKTIIKRYKVIWREDNATE